LSLDGKATVNIGAFSRGGYTRGDHQARDHDLGCKEKYSPCGIVDEDTGQLYVTFGSSYKTRDFIVETLAAWWQGLSTTEQGEIDRVQIKRANGSESSGVRTPCLHRLVQWVDTIGKPLQLLYYPPYHSKYNPIERCWGMMELHWNGAQLIDAETMREWAKRMTWKGVHPVVELSRKVYDKGVSLSKAAMRAVEARLERNLLLPKWDILIHPASAE
jgi:Rhodopirellula transposase DDE domain